MKILYGGSFNPPTLAHLKVYHQMMETFDVEEFVFMPTANIYSKPDLAPISHRLEMLRIMCDGLEKAVVSDFEANMTEYKGTSYTLKNFPGYYFLMGADNFSYIEKWIDYPNFIINNKFIVVPRDGLDLESMFDKDEYLTKYRNNFIIMGDFKEIDLSSTDFRNNFNKDIVPEKVYSYILKNGLYK